MPYSNLVMMCILALQLLALYLIIFLHKQLLAIGFVVASLILSAVIVILSRRVKQNHDQELLQNTELFNTLTTLFNHINQRHYQLHAEFQKVVASLDTTADCHQATAKSLAKLSAQQTSQQQADEQAAPVTTGALAQIAKTVNSLKTELDSTSANHQRHLTNEADWLSARLAMIAEQQRSLTQTAESVEELRLLALNLSIEVAKSGLPGTGLTRLVNDISRISKLSARDNQQNQLQLDELSKTLNKRRKTLLAAKNTNQSGSVEDVTEQTLAELANEVKTQAEGMATVQEQHLGLTDALKSQRLEMVEIDNGFKAIKEYFIECMIHLDELKQGLLTVDEFQQNLDKMNTMLADLYDTNKTVHRVNDVLKSSPNSS